MKVCGPQQSSTNSTINLRQRTRRICSPSHTFNFQGLEIVAFPCIAARTCHVLGCPCPSAVCFGSRRYYASAVNSLLTGGAEFAMVLLCISHALELACNQLLAAAQRTRPPAAFRRAPWQSAVLSATGHNRLSTLADELLRL